MAGGARLRWAARSFQSGRAFPAVSRRAGTIGTGRVHLSLHLLAQRHSGRAQRSTRRRRRADLPRHLPLKSEIGNRKSEIGNSPGASAFLTAKRFPSSMAISVRNGSSPENISAILSSGGTTMWRRTNSPWSRTTPRCESPKSSAALICFCPRPVKFCFTARSALQPPDFYHCPLMTDEAGLRLAKRHDALRLRALRDGG